MEPAHRESDETIHRRTTLFHTRASRSTVDGMDGLAALLDGPRARGAFLLRCLMDPPWAVRLEDESPLSLTAVVRGGLWALPDGGDAVPPRGRRRRRRARTRPLDHRRRPRDAGRRSSSTPASTAPRLDGQSLEEEMRQGVRSWGNSATGETVMLTGAYLLEGEVSRRLLRALPRFVVLSERELGSPLVTLLADEIVKDAPGPGRRAGPAPRPAADRRAARLVRASRGLAARLVRRAGRPRRRPGAPADAAPPRAPVDRGRARRGRRRLPRGLRPPLHRRRRASRR